MRGRGAGLNPGNRFETVRLHVLGEHLDAGAAAREAEAGSGGVRGPVSVPTTVLSDRSGRVINAVDSPDLPFKWTVNPYRGCEHGCVYCYARPGHEYLGMSMGLDFETKIVAKHGAAALLRRELASASWRGEPIVMSGVTDPYQPVERELGITRGCLEVMASCGQPVSVVTKSRLVERDIDCLSSLAGIGAARAAVSLTTLDRGLAMAMEPRASSPKDRLRAMSSLASAGVPVVVMTAPIIPGLNDHEIPALLKAAKEAGATRAGYILLRLPHQIKDVFLEWLTRAAPGRAAKVESLIRQARGGDLYRSGFGERQRGTGARADQIKATFGVFAERLGLRGEREELSSAGFRRPTVLEEGQLGLFGG